MNRALAVLSLALFGIGSAFALVTNFMVYYLEQAFGFNPGTAGLVASVSAVLPIVSAPLMGSAFDRFRNVKALLIVPAAVVTLGVGLAAVHSVYAALASVVLVGLASGAVFTVGLATARDVASSNPEYESLTVAWVDSFSLFGNFARSDLLLGTGREPRLSERVAHRGLGGHPAHPPDTHGGEQGVQGHAEGAGRGVNGPERRCRSSPPLSARGTALAMGSG